MSRCSVLSYFIFGLLSIVNAESVERKTRYIEYNSSVNLFLHGEIFMQKFFPDSIDYVRKPKAVVINSIKCRPSVDSDPQCRTLFYSGSDSLLLSVQMDKSQFWNMNVLRWCPDTLQTELCFLDSIRINNMGRNEWAQTADSLLSVRLGQNARHVQKIVMIQDMETDRLWGIFDGLYAGIFVGLAAMLVEIPYSIATDNDYNWNHVLYSSLGAAVGVSIIRCATYDTDPRSYRIQINLLQF